MMSRKHLPLSGLVLLAAACGGAGDDEQIDRRLTVTGKVVDFVSGQAVSGSASISTAGLSPAPIVVVQGTDFSIDDVPANSVFNVEAAVPPSYAPTSGSVTVLEEDAVVEVAVVPRTFLTQAATAFSVVPSASRGMLLVQLVSEAGLPRSQVAAASLSFYGDADVRGPFFLSESLAPSAGATATAGKGWVMYLEIDPGLVGMRAAAGANLTIDMPESPITAGAVTVVRATVTDGALVVPKNVSFSQTVLPIFARRGCNSCHAAGNGPGRQQGGLTLNDDASKVYRELVEERVGRVNVAMPDRSTLLTYPSRETPPDSHPNVTFTSPADPDYQKLRAWIAEGAKNN